MIKVFYVCYNEKGLVYILNGLLVVNCGFWKKGKCLMIYFIF